LPTAMDGMVKKWTRRAHGHLLRVGLPSDWLEMLVELAKGWPIGRRRWVRLPVALVLGL